MSDNETIASVAKTETTRQTVILVFSLAGTVGAIYLMNKFTEPDAFRMLKMTAALRAKHLAQRQADWWQRQADKAATVYNRERS